MKDDRVYLEHILECCHRIAEFTGGERSRFLRDIMVQEATLRSLQTPAESCNRLSDSAKQRHPDIDWRGIAGFRNVVVHDYLGLDLSLVWESIEGELPPLRRAVEALLEQPEMGL